MYEQSYLCSRYSAELVAFHSPYPAELVTLRSPYPAELFTLQSRYPAELVTLGKPSKLQHGKTWEKFPTSADPPPCGGWELCELGNNVRNLDPPPLFQTWELCEKFSKNIGSN